MHDLQVERGAGHHRQRAAGQERNARRIGEERGKGRRGDDGAERDADDDEDDPGEVRRHGHRPAEERGDRDGQDGTRDESRRQAQPVQEQSAAGGDKKGLGKARETAERHGLRTDPRL